MRTYAYTATTVILVGLLVGVGWLYYSNRIQHTDSILMFIIAQILGVWVGLTNKIFRIQNQNPEKPNSTP
jgi:F0F1-type ATP synthase assembly protein I